MKDILNFDLALGQIKTLLLNNETIRKLLYYDSPDALSKTMAPTIEQVESSITLEPVIENGIIVIDRNTAIVVYLRDIDLDTEDDPDLLAALYITVICSEQALMLKDNRNRSLAIAREIINDVDEAKIAALPGKLSVIKLENNPLNRHLFSKTIKVLAVDQSKESDF